MINRKLSIKVIICLLLAIVSHDSSGQDKLTLDQAIQIGLENNFNLKIASNNVRIAQNNTKPGNIGKNPTISGNASALYDVSSRYFEGLQTFTQHTVPLSVNLNANYVLFNSYRSLLSDQLSEVVELRSLEQKQAIENTILAIINAYYNITYLERFIDINKANIEISKRNLVRSEYSLEYGVGNSLGVLNNEVNVLNDSLGIQNATIAFTNAKNEFNVILGRNPDIDFRTNTEIPLIENMNLVELLKDAESKNIDLRLADQNINVNNQTLELEKKSTAPILSAVGGYNSMGTLNLNKGVIIGGASGQTFNYSLNNGFNAGLSLSWNLYDGGLKSVRSQNAKIGIENSLLIKDDLILQLKRDVITQYNQYGNALSTLELQNKIVASATINLEQSIEQHRLGNISTTTLREAQNNLLNANIGLLQAMLQAKFLETNLLQLSGNL